MARLAVASQPLMADWKSSRKVVRHAVEVFDGEKPVIVPSGSCAAMMFHGALLAFEKEDDLGEVKALGLHMNVKVGLRFIQ